MESWGMRLQGKEGLGGGPGTRPHQLMYFKHAGDLVKFDFLVGHFDYNADDGFELNKTGEDTWVRQVW